jgi:dolichol kinase
LYWGLADFRRFPGDRPFEQPLLQSEEEANQFSGIFWMLAGYTATIWLIPDYKLAIVGIWYLVVGDGFAGLVGKTWGRHLIGSGPKTWEGSLACWVGCLIVGTILMRGSMAWWIPAVGATATSFVEWLPMPWNDNFSLPLLSSVFLCLFLNS